MKDPADFCIARTLAKMQGQVFMLAIAYGTLLMVPLLGGWRGGFQSDVSLLTGGYTTPSAAGYRICQSRRCCSTARHPPKKFRTSQTNGSRVSVTTAHAETTHSLAVVRDSFHKPGRVSSRPLHTANIHRTVFPGDCLTDDIITIFKPLITTLL